MSRRLYGLMAEFDDPKQLVLAAESARKAGYRRMDAYSPMPIEELNDALGSHHSRLPLIVLLGGLIGCIGGFLIQYWTMAVAYPLNVGGRPFNSWPAFIPVTFECTILGAALSAVFGMLALNVPMPYPRCSTSEICAGQPEPVLLCIKRRTGSSNSRRTEHGSP
jgi:hypothetical protein